MKLWVACLIAATSLSCSAANGQDRVLVLEGGTLIDGTGRPPIADAVVIVEGTRIKAVGAKGTVSYPANATVIKVTGRTILPGLIDGHVHLKDYQLPMFMPYGVTTIADIHNDTTWILAQREALKTGKIKGPRLFVSGARVTGPFGSPTSDGSYVRDVAEARAYVRSLAARGVDLIKVDLTITDDQLRAVLEEANAAGLRVVGHTQNIRRAAEIGIKHMEHTDTMARALLDPEETTDPKLFPGCCRPVAPPQFAPERAVDPKLFPPLIEYLVAHGVYVNPTMVLTWGAATPRPREWANAAAQMIKDPGLGFVPADVRELWTRPPGPAREGYNNAAEFLRKYSEAGGKVIAATDTGCCAEIIPGLSLHYEMQLLTDVGIPPMKAIQGATLWAAEVIGQAKDLGSIEPGKLADFAVIEGDPLADIGATKNVRMVIKDGQAIDTTYDPHWVNPIPPPSRQAPQTTR